MSTAISPLAPAYVPDMPPIAGVRLATAAAGIRYPGAPTCCWRCSMPAPRSPACSRARNARRRRSNGAARSCKRRHGARALVVNSGNANAFTGKTGRAATKLTAEIAAKAAGCKPADDVPRLDRRDRRAARRRRNSTASWTARRRRRSPAAGTSAAKAIMTTDTFPKVATATCEIGKATVTINGIAKGAGMIAPDMATMLSFVFTDAPIAPAALQALLQRGRRRHLQRRDHRRRHLDLRHAAAVRHRRRRGARRAEDRARQRSAARGLPQGASTPCSPISPSRWRATAKARASWSRSWSRARCRKQSARRIAMSIANSPLVKTAIAGEDANWGRVVMAVGKAGEPADRDRLSIWFGGIRVAHKGARDPAYDEAAVVRGDEEARDRAEGRARPRQGPRPRADLRPHQGIRRDQRRLPLLADVPLRVCNLSSVVRARHACNQYAAVLKLLRRRGHHETSPP